MLTTLLSDLNDVDENINVLAFQKMSTSQILVENTMKFEQCRELILKQ